MILAVHRRQIEEERAAAADPVPELEPEPEAEEAEEDVPAKRRAAPRITNFSEDEKELIIDFLQQNPAWDAFYIPWAQTCSNAARHPRFIRRKP